MEQANTVLLPEKCFDGLLIFCVLGMHSRLSVAKRAVACAIDSVCMEPGAEGNEFGDTSGRSTAIFFSAKTEQLNEADE